MMRPWRKLSSDDIATIRRLAPTHTAAQIGAVLNRSARVVWYAAARYNIPMVAGCKYNRQRWTSTDRAEAYRLWLDGMDQQDIAARFGVARQTIGHWIARVTGYEPMR